MVKIGMIGTGSIAQVHLRGWRQLPVEIVGHFDISRAAATQASEAFGGSVYDRLEDLLAAVDIVDICTPGTVHSENVLAAAAAGCAIICEKPLARHVADCQAMIDACAAAGVPLYVAHVVRFFPEFAHAKAALDAGHIGNAAVIRTHRVGGFPRWGGAPGESYYGNFAKSGGVILDVGIHDIDFARWCCGEVKRVFARGTTFSETPDRDHALILLRFESGAIGHIQCSWAHPPGLFRTGFEIAGEEGLLEQDSLQPPSLTIQLQTADRRSHTHEHVNPVADEEYPYTAELAHFLDCYVNNKAPRVTAQDALMAVKISLAAIESVRSGKPVDIATFEEVFNG